MSSRPLAIVVGLGDASGTGSASARVFSKAGYSVALIARSTSNTPETLAQELNAAGGEAAAFTVPEYSYKDTQAAFQKIRAHWPKSELRVALYNASYPVFKRFLDVTEEDVDNGTNANIKAAFAFSREALLWIKEQPLDKHGKRGTLLFTGATASIRGNVFTSGFATGKSALRVLAQSLSKEFGKENIHVAHTIIDGSIATNKLRERNDEAWNSNVDNKLLPESIAESYLYLANQDRSAWTFELDLRPAHEKW